MKKTPNMMQTESDLFCGTRKRDRKAVGVIVIISLIVFICRAILQGSSDCQTIRPDSETNIGTTNDDYKNEGLNKNNNSNFEHIKSSTVLCFNNTDVKNETYKEIDADRKSISTNLECVDSSETNMSASVVETKTTMKNHNTGSLKYILQWTSGQLSPFYHMGNGQAHFFKFNCSYTNCFVTDNKTLLPNLTDYDAIVFNGNYVILMNPTELPQDRSHNQKYIFVGTEPAAYKLACDPVLDNFFNWTWTYRLDSDIHWRYVTVFDLNGTVVGPKVNMKWPEEMEPIDSETKMILNGKTKAAVWFVSRCKSLSHREEAVKKISNELKKFRLSVDVYGRCGNLACPKSNRQKCSNLVMTNYYFYLSFENSLVVDYVTEKLLTALHNYAVPVVYGGANYSRFLPPGSYLDARALNPRQLAVTMHDIINNKGRYYDFFRWRNHFKYKQADNSGDVCNVCTALNDQQMATKISMHKNFRKWWNDDWNSSCKH